MKRESCYGSGMSSKQIVRDLLDRLPEEVTLLEIAQEVEFLDGIREGVAQLDRGEFFTAEQLRARVKEWAGTK
jgi:predicted transcriptional regulator